MSGLLINVSRPLAQRGVEEPTDAVGEEGKSPAGQLLARAVERPTDGGSQGRLVPAVQVPRQDVDGLPQSRAWIVRADPQAVALMDRSSLVRADDAHVAVRYITGVRRCLKARVHDNGLGPVVAAVDRARGHLGTVDPGRDCSTDHATAGGKVRPGYVAASNRACSFHAAVARGAGSSRVMPSLVPAKPPYFMISSEQQGYRYPDRRRYAA